MAGFSYEQTEQSSGKGGGGFFSLKDDRDTAQVRFLFTDIEDVRENYARSVHEVTIDGKKRWVDCLREYGDPVDACPFCKAGRFLNYKYFLPVYNFKTNTSQIWERGKKFGGKISSMCSRYPNIVSHIFTIERNGKAGDQGTQYEIYEEEETQGVTIDDFEVQKPLGTLVLQKSAEDMEAYLRNGSFPNSGNSSRGNATEEHQSYQRRTPAGGRREAF